MKNEFLKFSSKRILFSAAMASALCVGSPQQAFANVNEDAGRYSKRYRSGCYR